MQTVLQFGPESGKLRLRQAFKTQLAGFNVGNPQQTDIRDKKSRD